ncbi:MAG: hypothetical protein P8Y53_12700, partial [Pseudolabrys sp.]
QSFPPDAAQDGDPEADGFLDTGFTCRLGGDMVTLVVTGAPVGTVIIGSYRFQRAAVEAERAAADPAATLVGVPHGILGQRLAGSAPDRQAVVTALRARGANALLAVAFAGPRRDAV